MPSRYDDFPSSSGFQIGTARITRPFLNNPTPDKYARIIERDWWVVPANYVPAVANRTAYTNYLTYSEQFDNAAWTALNATIGATALANPGDGTVTADSLLETVTNGEHRVSHSYTFTAVAHTLSVFAKAISRDYIRLLANDGTTNFSAFFNLTTGAVGTIAASTAASIIALEDGWYRCRITFTPAAAAGNVYLNTSTDGSTVSYAGDVTKGLYLFGAQIERASSAGPYISTTSTLRAISAPALDPGDTVNPADPFAYLVEEATPLTIDPTSRARYQRRWARIPTTQNTPKSLRVPKPSLSGDFPQVVGAYVVFQPDDTQSIFDAYTRKFVTSDSGAPSSDGYPTGGTYTLSFGGYTTSSINYNAAAATVQTELNALTSVSARGNLVVGGSYNSAGGLTILFNSYAQITINTGSLGGTIISNAVNTNGGYSQTVSAKRAAADISGNVASLVVSGGTTQINYNSFSSATRRDYNFQANTGTWTGGTYTLTIHGSTTAAIAYNASFSDVETAINALGIGTFTVTPYTASPGDTAPLSNGNTIIRATINWVRVPVSSGTFTLTAFASTTGSIAYNASAGTVQSSLNALTPVSDRGNCTVTGNLTDGFVAAFANSVLSAASSVTPSGSTVTPAISDGVIGRSQAITFSAGSAVVRAIYSDGNGITASDYVYLKAGSNYYTIAPGTYSLPDSSTVIIESSAGAVYTDASTITEVGPLAKEDYTPGTTMVRAALYTYFYLPGVTAGISTASDIPRPVFEGDDSTLLQLIFAGAATINYQVGDLDQWYGPIFSLTVLQLNAADL